MKKWHYITVALLTLLISVALILGSDKNKPGTIAKQWLSYYYSERYNKAKVFSTEETKEWLTREAQKQGHAASQMNVMIDIDIKSVTVRSDVATVSYTISCLPDSVILPPITLLRQNKHWLVQAKTMPLSF